MLLIPLIFVSCVNSQDASAKVEDYKMRLFLPYQDSESIYLVETDQNLVSQLRDFLIFMSDNCISGERLNDLEGVFTSDEIGYEKDNTILGRTIRRSHAKDVVLVSDRIVFEDNKLVILYHEMTHLLLDNGEHCDYSLEPDSCPKLMWSGLDTNMTEILCNWEEERIKLAKFYIR